jgi:pyruvate/2-oxoglutarate dehydrogenase complex dihydrolipoamide dehydrogenase (E3) component
VSEREFDVVVVGGGPAGEVAAGRIAERGLSVALVEDRLVGGECSYWACMPSKALLRPGQALDEARRVPGAAEAATGELDVGKALARRDEVIHDLDDTEQLPWLEDRGIALVRGHGTIAGERQVRVGGDLLRARVAVVLAVGTVAALPPVPGLEAARPWTNRESTTAKAVPGSLVVLGGGPVGCELAQAYASLGCAVTLVEVEQRLVAGEEPFAGEQLLDGLREWGVTVHLGVEATAVRRDADGTVTVETDGAGTLTADELLVASGRRQVVGELGLDALGIESARDGVEVGDDLRVPGHDWLYVVGDANGRALLTHMGKYQARVAADVIAGRDARVRGGSPPRVVFTTPNLASVGLTLAAAQEAGINARAVDAPTQATAGASFHGKGLGGTSRLVIDDDRGIVVGATFVGPDVSEWLHAATIAVVAAVPLDDLWHAVPAFPTRSEVWLKLLQQAGL